MSKGIKSRLILYFLLFLTCLMWLDKARIHFALTQYVFYPRLSKELLREGYDGALLSECAVGLIQDLVVIEERVVCVNLK